MSVRPDDDGVMDMGSGSADRPRKLPGIEALLVCIPGEERPGLFCACEGEAGTERATGGNVPQVQHKRSRRYRHVVGG